MKRIWRVDMVIVGGGNVAGTPILVEIEKR